MTQKDATGSVIAQGLRRDILSGVLAAGTRIDESALAKSYRSDPALMRIAVESMVARRLLRRDRSGVLTVTVIPAEDADDIYRARELIEREAIRRLATRHHVPRKAREANDRIRPLLAAGRPTEVVEPDMAFHISLIEAAGSMRVTTMFRTLADEVRLCMTQVQGAALLPMRLIVDEHDLIMKHISNGDEELATTAIHRHLSRARERLVAHITPRR